jgi:hypothetical protein
MEAFNAQSELPAKSNHWVGEMFDVQEDMEGIGGQLPVAKISDIDGNALPAWMQRAERGDYFLYPGKTISRPEVETRPIKVEGRIVETQFVSHKTIVEDAGDGKLTVKFLTVSSRDGKGEWQILPEESKTVTIDAQLTDPTQLARNAELRLETQKQNTEFLVLRGTASPLRA